MERRTSRARCPRSRGSHFGDSGDAPNPDVRSCGRTGHAFASKSVRRTRLSLAMAAGPGAVRMTTRRWLSQFAVRATLRTRHNARVSRRDP